MIFDLILLVIITIFVIIGVKRGFAAALIGIVISFVSYLAAAWVGRSLAKLFYENIIYPAIRGSIVDAVDKLATGVVGTVDEAARTLPGWLSGILSLSGKALDIDASGVTADISDTAINAVDTTARPMIVGFISVLLTIILFLLFCVLLKWIFKKPILKLFELPVINKVNMALGGVLGFLEGFLAVCMLAALLKLVLPYIDSQTSFLNESTIYNSFIFYHIYSGNIFTAILPLL